MEKEYLERLGLVTRHIQSNLDCVLRVEDLAKIAGFSSFHFHRIFSAFMGEPLGCYVRRLRLVRAAGQILESHRTITDIGLEAIYETPAAFTKAFRRYYGVSPSVLRKINR